MFSGLSERVSECHLSPPSPHYIGIKVQIIVFMQCSSSSTVKCRDVTFAKIKNVESLDVVLSATRLINKVTRLTVSGVF